MAISIAKVLELFDDEVESNVQDLAWPVAEIVQLQTLSVVGSAAHLTLVACSGAELEEIASGAISAKREELLLQCVLVAAAPVPQVREALNKRGHTYIFYPESMQISTATLIDTAITQSFAVDDRMIASAMRALALVARTTGTKGVLSELSRLVDGWAVLLDAHGQVIDSVGAGRLHIDDAISVVLNRPVRIRYPDLQVHVVGAQGEQTVRLVVAARSKSAYRTRTIAAHAAALIALTLRNRSASEVEHLGRELLLDQLVGRPDQALDLLQRWRVSERRLSAFKLSSKTRNIDVSHVTRLWLDRVGAAPLYVVQGSEAYGFVSSDALKGLAGFVAEFRTDNEQRLHLGCGSLMPVDRLQLTLTQAQRAHDLAVESDETVVWFSEISTVKSGLLRLTPQQRSHLSSVLDPLTLAEHSSNEFITTLRVFLRHHGSCAPAAKELGVHRQTLMNRVQRIEELLGQSLASADTRALLWLALRELDASVSTPQR